VQEDEGMGNLLIAASDIADGVEAEGRDDAGRRTA
jgi:hypothetical protein